ncbi:MAG TPA: aminotransferase class I/II-fold pyridoxal phosphate-dependent enzyme [Pseudonocardiaceae bacterium]
MVYTAEELAALAALVLRRRLTVVCDIYGGLVYDGADSVSMAALGLEVWERTVTVGGFSKTFAMTGWRIGYAAASTEIIHAMTAWQGHTTSAASSISQHAALAALRSEPRDLLADRLAELDGRRRLLCAEIDATPGLELAVRPRGAYFAFTGLQGGTAPRLADGSLYSAAGSPGPAQSSGLDSVDFARRSCSSVNGPGAGVLTHPPARYPPPDPSHGRPGAPGPRPAAGRRGCAPRRWQPAARGPSGRW